MNIRRNDKNPSRLSRRKLSRLGGWAFGLACAGLLAGFVRSESRSRVCHGLDIRITDGTGMRFVTPADIEGLLAGGNKQPVGRKLLDINTAMLEKLIRHNPYVAAVEVFSTVDGTLHIEIRQRTPVIRVINNEGEQFYIDDQGGFMPVSPQYTADVVVASGSIFDHYTDKNSTRTRSERSQGNSAFMADRLYTLAMYIQADPFWNAQIEQVYVNEKNEMELVPRVGNHIIHLGAAEALEEKFGKLRLFYGQGMRHSGWDTYTDINLKYHDQVVCSRP